MDKKKVWIQDVRCGFANYQLRKMAECSNLFLRNNVNENNYCFGSTPEWSLYKIITIFLV